MNRLGGTRITVREVSRLPHVETLTGTARGTETSLHHISAFAQVSPSQKSVPRFPPGQESQWPRVRGASQNLRSVLPYAQTVLTQFQAMSRPDNLDRDSSAELVSPNKPGALVRETGNAEYPPTSSHGEKGGDLPKHRRTTMKIHLYWQGLGAT